MLLPPAGVNTGNRITWPDDKDFAFTVFDDTDFSTLENVREIYSLLMDFGFQTTKSVWPTGGKRGAEFNEDQGSTCEEEDYLHWVKELQKCRFEIGYHSASFHESNRDQVIYALGVCPRNNILNDIRH